MRDDTALPYRIAFRRENGEPGSLKTVASAAGSEGTAAESGAPRRRPRLARPPTGTVAGPAAAQGTGGRAAY